MIYYYRSNQYRPALKLRDSLQGGSWTRVEAPDDKELSQLAAKGIDLDLLTDALDPHEVPRVEHSPNWTYFIARVPDLGDGFGDFTTPVLFAISREQLVTVSGARLGRLWQPFIDSTKVPTTQQAKLFIQMMEWIIRTYHQRVDTINREMRAASGDVMRLRPRDITQIVSYERKLNDYLDALTPTNTALERLLSGKAVRLYDEDLELVEDLSVDAEQVIARCTSLLRTITNLRDSYRAVMDTRLNETMRVLTVVTVALTIPTMLAGLLGMNVDFPFDTRGPLAFWCIVCGSVISAVIVSYYFIRKR